MFTRQSDQLTKSDGNWWNVAAPKSFFQKGVNMLSDFVAPVEQSPARDTSNQDTPTTATTHGNIESPNSESVGRISSDLSGTTDKPKKQSGANGAVHKVLQLSDEPNDYQLCSEPVGCDATGKLRGGEINQVEIKTGDPFPSQGDSTSNAKTSGSYHCAADVISDPNQISSLPVGKEVEVSGEIAYPGFAFVETNIDNSTNSTLSDSCNESPSIYPDNKKSETYNTSFVGPNLEDPQFLPGSQFEDEEEFAEFYGSAQVEFDPSFYDSNVDYENVGSFYYPDFSYEYYSEQIDGEDDDGLHFGNSGTKVTQNRLNNQNSGFSSIPEEPISPGTDKKSPNSDSHQPSRDHLNQQSDDLDQTSANNVQFFSERVKLEPSFSSENLSAYKNYLQLVSEGRANMPDSLDEGPETCILDDDDEDYFNSNEDINQSTSEIPRSPEKKTRIPSVVVVEASKDEGDGEAFVDPNFDFDGTVREEDSLDGIQGDLEIGMSPVSSFDNNSSHDAVEFEDPFRIVYDDYEPEIEAICAADLDEEAESVRSGVNQAADADCNFADLMSNQLSSDVIGSTAQNADRIDGTWGSKLAESSRHSDNPFGKDDIPIEQQNTTEDLKGLLGWIEDGELDIEHIKPNSMENTTFDYDEGLRRENEVSPGDFDEADWEKREYKLRRDKFLGRIDSGGGGKGSSSSNSNLLQLVSSPSSGSVVQTSLLPSGQVDSSTKSPFKDVLASKHVSIPTKGSSHYDELAQRKQVEEALRNAMAHSNAYFDYKKFSMELDLADIANVLREIELMSQQQETLQADAEIDELQDVLGPEEFFDQSRKGSDQCRLESEESVQSEESKVSVVDIDSFGYSAKSASFNLSQSSMNNSYPDISASPKSPRVNITEEFDLYYRKANTSITECEDYSNNFDPENQTEPVNEPYQYFSKGFVTFTETIDPEKLPDSQQVVETPQNFNSQFSSNSVFGCDNMFGHSGSSGDSYPSVFGSSEHQCSPENFDFENFDINRNNNQRNWTNYSQMAKAKEDPEIQITESVEANEEKAYHLEEDELGLYENIPAYDNQTLNADIENYSQYQLSESPNFAAEYYPNSLERNNSTEKTNFFDSTVYDETISYPEISQIFPPDHHYPTFTEQMFDKNLEEPSNESHSTLFCGVDNFKRENVKNEALVFEDYENAQFYDEKGGADLTPQVSWHCENNREKESGWHERGLLEKPEGLKRDLKEQSNAEIDENFSRAGLTSAVDISPNLSSDYHFKAEENPGCKAASAIAPFVAAFTDKDSSSECKSFHVVPQVGESYTALENACKSCDSVTHLSCCSKSRQVTENSDTSVQQSSEASRCRHCKQCTKTKSQNSFTNAYEFISNKKSDSQSNASQIDQKCACSENSPRNDKNCQHQTSDFAVNENCLSCGQLNSFFQGNKVSHNSSESSREGSISVQRSSLYTSPKCCTKTSSQPESPKDAQKPSTSCCGHCCLSKTEFAFLPRELEMYRHLYAVSSRESVPLVAVTSQHPIIEGQYENETEKVCNKLDYALQGDFQRGENIKLKSCICGAKSTNKEPTFDLTRSRESGVVKDYPASNNALKESHMHGANDKITSEATSLKSSGGDKQGIEVDTKHMRLLQREGFERELLGGTSEFNENLSDSACPQSILRTSYPNTAFVSDSSKYITSYNSSSTNTSITYSEKTISSTASSSVGLQLGIQTSADLGLSNPSMRQFLSPSVISASSFSSGYSLGSFNKDLLSSSEKLNLEIKAITGSGNSQVSKELSYGSSVTHHIEVEIPEQAETPLLSNLGKGVLDSSLTKAELSQIHQEAINARRREEQLQKMESRRLNDILELCSSISSRPSSTTSLLDGRNTNNFSKTDKSQTSNAFVQSSSKFIRGSPGSGSTDDTCSLQSSFGFNAGAPQPRPQDVAPPQLTMNLFDLSHSMPASAFKMTSTQGVASNEQGMGNKAEGFSLDRFGLLSPSSFNKYASASLPSKSVYQGEERPASSSDFTRFHSLTPRLGLNSSFSRGGRVGELRNQLELLQTGFESSIKQQMAELQWLKTKYDKEMFEIQKEREFLKQVSQRKDSSETALTKLYNHEMQSMTNLAHTIELLKAQHQITGQQIEVCPESHREQWLMQYASEANQLAQCLKNFEAVQMRVNKLNEDIAKQDSSLYKQLADQEQVLSQKVRSKALYVDSLETNIKKLDLQMENDRKHFFSEKEKLNKQIQLHEANDNGGIQDSLSSLQTFENSSSSSWNQTLPYLRSSSAMDSRFPSSSFNQAIPISVSPVYASQFSDAPSTKTPTNSNRNFNLGIGMSPSARNTPISTFHPTSVSIFSDSNRGSNFLINSPVAIKSNTLPIQSNQSSNTASGSFPNHHQTLPSSMQTEGNLATRYPTTSGLVLKFNQNEPALTSMPQFSPGSLGRTGIPGSQRSFARTPDNLAPRNRQHQLSLSACVSPVQFSANSNSIFQTELPSQNPGGANLLHPQARHRSTSRLDSRKTSKNVNNGFSDASLSGVEIGRMCGINSTQAMAFNSQNNSSALDSGFLNSARAGIVNSNGSSRVVANQFVPPSPNVAPTSFGTRISGLLIPAPGIQSGVGFHDVITSSNAFNRRT